MNEYLKNELVEFEKLALGARFEYIDDSSKVWVKISPNTIVRWKEKNKANRWLGQAVYSFDENDDTSKMVYVL